MGALLLSTACSGSDDGAPGALPNGAAGAVCGEIDTVVLDGTLGDQPVQRTEALGSFAWINTGKPSRFDATWSGGSTHLEWSGTIASGQTASLTTGTLTLETSPGARTFTSGEVVYTSDRQSSESTLKASLTFDTGTVSLCIRKK